jgi:hypothetical protein
VVADPLDLVEVLHDEPERILDADGGANTVRRAGRESADLATAIGVEHGGNVEILRGSHTKSEPRARRFRALAKDEAVMNELFVPAEIDRVIVFGADDEPDPVDPEMLARAQV